MIGQIYKITNDIDDRFYVGSTRRSLGARFAQHKYDSNTETRSHYTKPLAAAMRELGVENFHISSLETFECKDKTEMHIKEQEYIDEHQPEFNGQAAYASEERKLQVVRAYRERNKDYIYARDKDRVKQWHTENKEHVKAYKAQLYQQNKEAESTKGKAKYAANKEAIKARVARTQANSPVVSCGCGLSYKTCRKSAHIKTKTHTNWLANQDE